MVLVQEKDRKIVEIEMVRPVSKKHVTIFAEKIDEWEKEEIDQEEDNDLDLMS